MGDEGEEGSRLRSVAGRNGFSPGRATTTAPALSPTRQHGYRAVENPWRVAERPPNDEQADSTDGAEMKA